MPDDGMKPRMPMLDPTRYRLCQAIAGRTGFGVRQAERRALDAIRGWRADLADDPHGCQQLCEGKPQDDVCQEPTGQERAMAGTSEQWLRSEGATKDGPRGLQARLEGNRRRVVQEALVREYRGSRLCHWDPPDESEITLL